VFLTAIDNNDYETFFKYGNALKRIKAREFCADHWRLEILKLKREAENTGVNLTLREVAVMITWPKNDAANGHPQLRRLCQALKYPIKPSRQIRRKG